MKKALEPIAAVLTEGGLNSEEAFTVAAALADLGVEEPAHLADVSEKYARQAANAAGLKPIRADKLVKIIKAPAPKHGGAEEPSPVAAHLINDFKMNAKVHCSVFTSHTTHIYNSFFLYIFFYIFFTHTHTHISLFLDLFSFPHTHLR